MAGCFSSPDDCWQDCPDFIHDANACLKAWERVIRHKNWLGSVITRIVGEGDSWYAEMDGNMLNYNGSWYSSGAKGTTMLEAMCECMIYALEAMKGGEG